jgi:serine/threonine protein kinase
LYEEIDERPKGFGGYGTVYKYRCKATGETVAVKLVVPPATKDDPEVLLKRSGMP